MGWKFWKREQTEAEQSLAALQQQAADAAPAPVPAPPEPAPEVALTPGQAHMEQVMLELGVIFAEVPREEQGRFMLEVAGIEEREDGTLLLTGGIHEGTVATAAVVGLMVVPADAADVGDDPQEQDEALLGVRARSATVVSWTAEPPSLVVSGLRAQDVTTGSMVTR